MPSWSQTDTLPFRRFEPSVQLRTFASESHVTTPAWSERAPYADFIAPEPVQLSAPQQSVALPPKGQWAAAVARAQEVEAATRAALADPARRPARAFLGLGAEANPRKPVKQFLYR